MASQEERTQGIVLRAFDYKDKQRILTLFTQEAGIVSLIVKGISKKNYRLLALTSPFSQIEVIFSKGKSELFRFIDGAILEEHLSIRNKYAFVQTAGILTQLILQSQLPGKASPALYQLFCSFLKQIPTFENPSILLCSFRLKLLRHEGLIALSPQCAYCSNPARFLLQGESVCLQHQTPEALCFTDEEWNTLHILENAQHFSLLRTLPLPPHFQELIASYFQQQIAHH